MRRKLTYGRYDDGYSICYLSDIKLGCFVCIASIISHIVRRHILWDRQHDLVCRINWNIQQQGDKTEIEALKFEEQNVFSSMSYHKRMIIMNIINIIVLLVLAVVIFLVFGVVQNAI